MDIHMKMKDSIHMMHNTDTDTDTKGNTCESRGRNENENDHDDDDRSELLSIPIINPANHHDNQQQQQQHAKWTMSRVTVTVSTLLCALTLVLGIQRYNSMYPYPSRQFTLTVPRVDGAMDCSIEQRGSAVHDGEKNEDVNADLQKNSNYPIPSWCPAASISASFDDTQYITRTRSHPPSSSSSSSSSASTNAASNKVRYLHFIG
jgi:hypothetical protein